MAVKTETHQDQDFFESLVTLWYGSGQVITKVYKVYKVYMEKFGRFKNKLHSKKERGRLLSSTLTYYVLINLYLKVY